MKKLLRIFKTNPKPKVTLTKKDLVLLSKRNVIFKVADIDPYFKTESITIN